MKRVRFFVAIELGAGAFRSVLATLLAAILVLQTALVASGSAAPKVTPHEQSEQTAALKRRVLKIQPQSMVNVKLNNKETLRGRLTEVTDEGFTVKVLQGEAFADRQFAYSEVKSVEAEKSGGSQVKKWLLIGVVAGAILTGVGILMLLNSDS
jgi:hypothetical protein